MTRFWNNLHQQCSQLKDKPCIKNRNPNAGKTHHVSPPNTTTNVVHRTYTQEEFEDTKGVATAQRKKMITPYNSQLPQNRRIIPGALEGVLLSNNMLAAVYTTYSGRVAAILL